jgi:hypothetical protein
MEQVAHGNAERILHLLMLERGASWSFRWHAYFKELMPARTATVWWTLIFAGRHFRKAGLFSLDAGRADYLCPFLGIVDDELAEIGGRACKCLRAQLVEPELEFGIGQPGR